MWILQARCSLLFTIINNNHERVNERVSYGIRSTAPWYSVVLFGDFLQSPIYRKMMADVFELI